MRQNFIRPWFQAVAVTCWLQQSEVTWPDGGKPPSSKCCLVPLPFWQAGWLCAIWCPLADAILSYQLPDMPWEFPPSKLAPLGSQHRLLRVRASGVGQAGTLDIECDEIVGYQKKRKDRTTPSNIKCNSILFASKNVGNIYWTSQPTTLITTIASFCPGSPPTLTSSPCLVHPLEVLVPSLTWKSGCSSTMHNQKARAAELHQLPIHIWPHMYACPYAFYSCVMLCQCVNVLTEFDSTCCHPLFVQRCFQQFCLLQLRNFAGIGAPWTKSARVFTLSSLSWTEQL